MEKQQLIDYIMNSPENTNPAILNQMIDEISGGGSMENFIVNFILDEENNVSSDKTYAEILEAWNNGANVKGLVSYDPPVPEPIMQIPLVRTETNNEITDLIFNYITPGLESNNSNSFDIVNLSSFEIVVKEDDTITIRESDVWFN